jgi:predicted ATPase
LRQDLAESLSGTGRLILIEGEAGIGKSRLMVEIAHQAQEVGAAVLWGVSTALEQRSPYRPLVEALESYLIGRPAEERAALAARFPQLPLLVPSLGPVSAGISVDLGREMLHGMLTAQLVSIFTEVSHRQPLVVALDDLHGADAASMDLLHVLARASLGRPWLLLASYRAEQAEIGTPLFALLAAFRREGLGRPVTLGRLSRHDTGRLALAVLGGGGLDEAALDRLYGLSHGNPLFLVELTRALLENGELRSNAGRWTLTPNPDVGRHGRVADAVAARFDVLGRDVHQVLTLAAVKGPEFPLSTLLTAAEFAFGTAYDRESILTIIDRALAAGILEDRGDLYAFNHLLIRTSLLERLPSHRRARLHGAVARAIERERPGELQGLAYHYSHSDSPEKAIPYIERTGRGDHLAVGE